MRHRRVFAHLTGRIIVVADVYQVLNEERPYRDGLPLTIVLGMMNQDVPHRLDRYCVAALKSRSLTNPNHCADRAWSERR